LIGERSCRYLCVFQERAEEMAQHRAMRANQRWNDFWIQKAA
jgi:hypothetical protein